MDFFGVVEHWNEARGFGFVELHDRRRIFCHITTLRAAGLDKLRAGQRVDVDIATGADGRLRVTKIALVEAAETAGRDRTEAVWTHPGRD